MKIIEAMDAVKNGLEIASEYNLEVEVVVFAMKALKENNKLTISEAMSIGIDEWIK